MTHHLQPNEYRCPFLSLHFYCGRRCCHSRVAPSVAWRGGCKVWVGVFGKNNNGCILRRWWCVIGEVPWVATGIFTTLVGLFERVGRCTTSQNSHPEVVYNDRCLSASTHADRKRLRVECDICGQGMQAASLQSHLETQHDVFRSFVLNRELEGDQPAATFWAEAAPPLAHTTVQYRTAVVWPALLFLWDDISSSDTPNTWLLSHRRGPPPTHNAPDVACRHRLNLLTEAINSRSDARDCMRWDCSSAEVLLWWWWIGKGGDIQILGSNVGVWQQWHSGNAIKS